MEERVEVLKYFSTTLTFSFANYLDTVFQPYHSDEPEPVSYTHLDVYKRQVRSPLLMRPGVHWYNEAQRPHTRGLT